MGGFKALFCTPVLGRHQVLLFYFFTAFYIFATHFCRQMFLNLFLRLFFSSQGKFSEPKEVKDFDFGLRYNNYKTKFMKTSKEAISQDFKTVSKIIIIMVKKSVL